MTVTVAGAVILWSAAAAILVGYLMMWLTTTTGDSPWYAVSTAFLVLSGGVFLAAKDEPWVIGGFVLIAAQCLVIYLMWQMWVKRPREKAKELTQS